MNYHAELTTIYEYYFHHISPYAGTMAPNPKHNVAEPRNITLSSDKLLCCFSELKLWNFRLCLLSSQLHLQHDRRPAKVKHYNKTLLGFLRKYQKLHFHSAFLQDHSLAIRFVATPHRISGMD